MREMAAPVTAMSLRALDRSDPDIANLIRNEYKRQQAAPGLKVTARAFGVGRRMPIAQKYID